MYLYNIFRYNEKIYCQVGNFCLVIKKKKGKYRCDQLGKNCKMNFVKVYFVSYAPLHVLKPNMSFPIVIGTKCQNVNIVEIVIIL